MSEQSERARYVSIIELGLLDIHKNHVDALLLPLSTETATGVQALCAANGWEYLSTYATEFTSDNGVHHYTLTAMVETRYGIVKATVHVPPQSHSNEIA